MEEQNTTNPNEKNELEKKDRPKESKAKKQDKKNSKPGFSETVGDYKAEFRKIIWPNKEELSKKTVTVVITSLLIGAIIFCMDTVYTTGLNLLYGLLG